MHQLYTQVVLLNGLLTPLQTYIAQIDVQLDVIKKGAKKVLSTSANTKFTTAEQCLNKCDSDFANISNNMAKITKTFPAPKKASSSSSSSGANANMLALGTFTLMFLFSLII